MVTADVGGYYDGWRVSLGAMPTWSGIPDLEIGGLVQYNLVQFPARGPDVLRAARSAHACWRRSASSSRPAPSSSTTATTTRCPPTSASAINPREGTDVYLVYNEGLNIDRLSRIPVPPVSSGRALYVKFNYTFNF